MWCSNCTTLHYGVTLHLLADCDGQLDGTGWPHRVVVTVHFVPSNTSWRPSITAMNIINNELQSCIGQFEILAQHGDSAARIKVPATPGWSVP
jgi:hypothetical protein